jgi:hypothetical protein
MRPLLTSLLAAAALAAVPAAASADTLIAPAPGGQNLAGGGGYLVWAAPAEGGGWQLAVRSPDGTITTPNVARFRVAPDPAIGSDRNAAAGRRLLAVYSRDGDVFALNLRTGTEERVAGASTRAYEEYAPSVVFGSFAFVRRGGRTNGVFTLRDGRLHRVTTARPRELAYNGSRVAYPSGRNVVVRRVSGEGRPSIVRTPSAAFSLVLTRYSVTWLVRGGQVLRTPRFGGSSDVDRVTTARAASRRLPASTNSIADRRGLPGYALDGEGVKRIDPRLFRG